MGLTVGVRHNDPALSEIIFESQHLEEPNGRSRVIDREYVKQSVILAAVARHERRNHGLDSVVDALLPSRFGPGNHGMKDRQDEMAEESRNAGYVIALGLVRNMQ